MSGSTYRRARAALPFAIAVLVLAGCTAPPAPNDAAGNNDEAAARFVACLQAAGQTAGIIEGGMVALLLPEDSSPDEGESFTSEGSGGDGPSMTSLMMDDRGTWQASDSAAGYPEEGGLRAAWAGCEEEVPEFEQPEPDMSGGDFKEVTSEEAAEASLAFAECARENGFAGFPDPDANGMLNFPAGVTEDGFRALLDACIDEDSDIFPSFSQESTESFDFDWMAVMHEFMEGAGGSFVGGGSN